VTHKGCHVLIAERKPDEVYAKAKELNNAGLQANALVFDASDERHVLRAYSEIEFRHGRMDILVNNAGI